MKRTKLARILAVILVLVMGVSACSGKVDKSDKVTESPSVSDEASTAAPETPKTIDKSKTWMYQSFLKQMTYPSLKCMKMPL